MGQQLFGKEGAQTGKGPKWTPLLADRLFTGLFTNRAPLGDTADSFAAKLYYGGRKDTLWDDGTGDYSKNVELTNKLTLQRRFGLSEFSSFLYPTPPNRAYRFELSTGDIQVIIDTPSGVYWDQQDGNVVLLYSKVGAPITADALFAGLPGNPAVAVVSAANDFENGQRVYLSGTINGSGELNGWQTVLIANPVTGQFQFDFPVTGDIEYFNGTPDVGFVSTSGPAYFQSVGDILYIGDGPNLYAYTPLNTNVSGIGNNQIWLWGIQPPTNQPLLTVTPSGSAAVAWQADTAFTTMGLVIDAGAGGTGDIFQLVNVNAALTNSTQFATTGNGQPAWNQIPGGTTTDNTITWTNKGPIVAWTPDTAYNNATLGGTLAQPCIIYDPGCSACYISTSSSVGTSSQNKPKFTGAFGQKILDGTDFSGVFWFCLGSPKIMGIWQPSTAYPALGSVHDNDSVSGISEPVGPVAAGIGGATPQQIFWQTSAGGTSGTGGTGPFQMGTAVGTLTTDNNNIQWLALGSPTWTAGRTILGYTTFGAVFTAIKDSNGNFQVALTSGTAGTVQPVWLTEYGQVTTETGGTLVQWVNVGPSMNWVASTIFYLPVGGFAPPTGAGAGTDNPYPGSIVVDTNGNLQAVIASGVSAGSHPVWATILNNSTTDGTITWRMVGTQSVESLSWLTSHTWAVSYKARSTDDYYSTKLTTTSATGVSTTALPIPPGRKQPLPAITGSGTGDISSASPVTTLTGANAGAVVQLQILGSTNPAVDTIVIWRDADGGGLDNMFELTEIPNVPPINGVAQFAYFNDYLPDIPTTVSGVLLPGLDNLSPAPIDDVNDPPPAGYLPMAFYYERIWGSVGNTAYISGGPDTLVGNPNSCFNPSDNFSFSSQITRIQPNPSVMLCFTTSDIDGVYGGPQTASFYPGNVSPGIGLRSFNALDTYGGEVYFFSSGRQFMTLSPNLSVAELGFPVQNVLANIDPTNAYVAVLQAEGDNSIYVGTGLSPSAVGIGTITPGTDALKAALGIAATYALLAAAGITNSGATLITGGNIGSFPTTSITGFVGSNFTPPATTDNTDAAAAQTAALSVYNLYSGLTFVSLSASSADLSVLGNGATASTYNAGNYSAGTSMDIPTSITLDAQGNPNAVFVFKAGSTLVLESGASIILANGAQAENVVWLVGSSATTVGTVGVFNGNILANTSISLGGGTLNGRALAGIVTSSGAITIATATNITVPSIATVLTPGGGTGTGWYRLNPRQMPEQTAVWSPFAAPVTGCKMLQTIEISTGVHKLLVGSTLVNEPIGERNTSIFTDLGASYPSYFTIGSLVLCPPSQIAVLGFIEGDYAALGDHPQVSVLLNEVSGDFTNVPFTGIYDSPSVYGDSGTIIPTSYYPLRYEFSGILDDNTEPRVARHLMMQFDFGVQPVGSELWDFTLYGHVMQEK
jgi:hypothetical protein